MKTKALILSLAAAFSTVGVSRADLIDMQALWSSPNSGASATATFTLDTSLFNNPGNSDFTGSEFADAFQNFQLTISGTTSGDGVYTANDYSFAALDTGGGTLDFHSELVGQSTPSGAWGTVAGRRDVGNFIFMSNSQSTPEQDRPFHLQGVGHLTSFAPVAPAAPAAVPETSTWVMGFFALGAIVFLVRRPVAARS